MEKVMIGRFKDNPKTKIAWWAMGAGLSTLFTGSLLIIFAPVIRPSINMAFNVNVVATIGFGFMIINFMIIISALILGFIGYRRGERSWVLWLGFIPTILSGLFWFFMIIGELFFHTDQIYE